MTFMPTTSAPVEPKQLQWDKRYVVQNLPVWVYTDNPQPTTLSECKAKISSLKYTIEDIELQIQIRELELETGSSRHSTSYELQKWKAQALRARQTHLYMLNAYSYWLLLNEREENDDRLSHKIDTMIHLLIEDPVDFVPQMEKLLESHPET